VEYEYEWYCVRKREIRTLTKNKRAYLGVGLADLLWGNYPTDESFDKFQHLKLR